MILDPEEHRLYTEALRPPPGCTFDQGLATTFTLDLTTLLTVPLYLTLFAREENSEDLLNDGVGLLEALRRTTDRLNVYCHQGQIAVPVGRSVLFGLLERVVHEARAPGRGFFHPKLWVLRYVGEDETSRLRLLIPTRNLTGDRSWDLLLVLDGVPQGKRKKSNAGLAELVSRLPKLVARGSPKADRSLTALLADEIHRTVWECPEPFREVRFHALGLDRGDWSLPESDQLLILSPYVTDDALLTLQESSGRCVGLVSRMEELARLRPSTLQGIEEVFHFDPVVDAGMEDAGFDLLRVLTGFHAKAYLLKRGWDAHVFVGSTNATGAGLGGANVEILAELVGRWSKVGKPEAILEESGLSNLLIRYVPLEEPIVDDEEERARAQLDRARRGLIDAAFRVRCEERDGSWWLALDSKRSIPAAADLIGIESIRVWPITLSSELGRDLFLTEAGQPIDFPCALASLTGFFAFHVEAKDYDLELQFVLNLPVEGMPKERYGAILRSILSDPQRFIRYLLLLLGTDEDGWLAAGSGTGAGFDRRGSYEDVPLLEEMVRALCRDPDRLQTVRTIVQRLLQDEGAKDIVPDRFLELWDVIRAELEGAPR